MARVTPLEPQDSWVPGTSAYVDAHQYVRYVRGRPEVCEDCGITGKLTWSNLTGQYHDPDDYKSRCYPYHSRADKNPNFPCGHPRTDGYTDERGHRRCKPCVWARNREAYRRKKHDPVWLANRKKVHAEYLKRRKENANA